MKKALQFILRLITKIIIKRYNPVVVSVTGTVGKTSTKESIHDAFSGFYRIRKSEGNLNTDIGAPLVFWGIKEPGNNIKEWIFILLKGFWTIIKKDKNYPEIIIVELAADRPGDIEYLASFINSQIGIITMIGEVPVHVEFYKNIDQVVEEKKKIIKSINENGFLIFNFDDPKIANLKKDKLSKKINKISFGFKKESDILIKNFECNFPEGSSVVINYKDEDFSLFLSGCIGDSFAYIAASVFATGIGLGIEAKRIPEMIEKIRPTKGRLFIVKGKNDSTILDGSYNSSPASMRAGLLALKNSKGKRKIAVIGDMLEIGKYSQDEHKKIGKEAILLCDYVFFIGKKSKDAYDTVFKKKEGFVFWFENSEKAIPSIKKILSSGDVILVKGSQGIRTEKIVYAIMRDPERAEDILVRQESKWKNN